MFLALFYFLFRRWLAKTNENERVNEYSLTIQKLQTMISDGLLWIQHYIANGLYRSLLLFSELPTNHWTRRFHSIVYGSFLFPSILRLLFSFNTLKIHCNLWWCAVWCQCVCVVHVRYSHQQQQTYLYSVWSMLSFKRVHYHCQQHIYRYVFTVRFFIRIVLELALLHEICWCFEYENGSHEKYASFRLSIQISFSLSLSISNRVNERERKISVRSQYKQLRVKCIPCNVFEITTDDFRHRYDSFGIYNMDCNRCVVVDSYRPKQLMHKIWNHFSWSSISCC